MRSTAERGSVSNSRPVVRLPSSVYVTPATLGKPPDPEDVEIVSVGKKVQEVHATGQLDLCPVDDRNDAAGRFHLCTRRGQRDEAKRSRYRKGRGGPAVNGCLSPQPVLARERQGRFNVVESSHGEAASQASRMDTGRFRPETTAGARRLSRRMTVDSERELPTAWLSSQLQYAGLDHVAFSESMKMVVFLLQE